MVRRVYKIIYDEDELCKMSATGKVGTAVPEAVFDAIEGNPDYFLYFFLENHVTTIWKFKIKQPDNLKIPLLWFPTVKLAFYDRSIVKLHVCDSLSIYL